MLTLKAEDPLEFARLWEQLRAQLKDLDGAEAARETMGKLDWQLVMEGADMARLYRNLTRGKPAAYCQRVRDHWEANGYDTGEGF
jgi:hypothetical protein